MRRRFTIATALAVLFTCMLGAATVSAAAKHRGCARVSAIPNATTLPQAQEAVLCLVNHERARRRLSGLRSSTQLTRAALGHSTDMVSQEYFAHDSLDGSTLRQRVLRTGYLRGSAAGTLEETLACGWVQLSTPKALVASLMSSPTHRSTVLNPSLRDIGIGLVLGAPRSQPGMAGGATLTLDFARR